MMTRKFLFNLCVIMMINATGFAQKPTGLMVDLLANSTAGEEPSVQIISKNPAFSWIMNNTHANARQTAYQIVVRDDEKPAKVNVWNSGKINSNQSAGIRYAGAALQSGHRYYWKVRVWDQTGKASLYADEAPFTMAQTLTDYATTRYLIQKTDEKPVKLTKAISEYRIDFGKDAFGQLKLRLNSKSGNDTITIRFGEVLDGQGNINRHPGGTIRYAEYQLPLQTGTHEYHVRLRADKRNTGPNAIKMPDYIGEVMPFRYCELAGYNQPLAANDVKRVFVHYPFNDDAASFHSSDTLLNKIWELCKYTVKATSFAGVYIDGDRERIPYEADAYINQLCHYSVDREYTLARYSHEYLINHATWPTEWILQSVLMAGNDYLYTGDSRSAQHFYEQLKAKSLTSLEDPNGLISSKNTTPKILNDIHIIMRKEPHGLADIVDWPQSGVLGLKAGSVGETDNFVFTDYNAVVNAYYYKALTTMQMLAAAIGKTDDAAMYQKKASALKQKYRELLWDAKQGVFCDGVSTRHAALHTNVFALAFGLADAADHESMMKFIRSRGMACSVYGSQFLLDAVYNAGDGDYGLKLLTSKEKRSWYHMMELGSTLTLEAWDNDFKPNQDWNHVWGAAPGNIIPRKLMGIEPLTPGWAKFKIAPQPGSLSEAGITIPTIKGSISVSFKQGKSSFAMQTVIPANTVADVYLPKSDKSAQITMDGKSVSVKATENGWLVSKIGSGKHKFIVISN